MYNVGQHFSSSFFSFFFIVVHVSTERERERRLEWVNRTAGQPDESTVRTHIHTDSIVRSFVLLLSISQMTRRVTTGERKRKKKMDACYYISMRIYIRICISITTLVFDQLYVQTRNGGKIEPWRKHGMSGEARRRMT